MAQIRESRFAVVGVWEDDVDLLDIATGYPLSVETDHEYYNHQIIDQISNLQEGDVINAMIQSEDILQPNSIWRFLTIHVIGTDPKWRSDQ